VNPRDFAEKNWITNAVIAASKLFNNKLASKTDIETNAQLLRN